MTVYEWWISLNVHAQHAVETLGVFLGLLILAGFAPVEDEKDGNE